MKTAREIMHTGAACVQETETLMDAARRMSELDVGALPICGPDDRLQKDPSHMTAGQLAQGKPVTVDAEAGADQVLAAMQEHRIRRVPVIADHRLVGMISEADIARHLSDEQVGHFVETISATR